ncbi:COG1361 S-layer family protein [Methanoregula sp.]|uniref:COG1361 S-layer family protein n=1 Tax=Methanoregula sp. TaxID=2052170 RepID=UPI00356235B8
MISPHSRTRTGVLPLAARIVFIILVAALICQAPVLAVAYIYDVNEHPDLGANVQGEPEFFPGDDFVLTVDLTNAARAESMEVASLKANLYNPTTALVVYVIPEAGAAPVTIKSLPVTAGDIGSSDIVPVTIRGTVSPDARPGTSVMFLNVSYQYIHAMPNIESGIPTVTPVYEEVHQLLPITFRVKGQVQPVVSGTGSLNMVPGTQGYLNITLKNAGYATGRDVAFILVPADNTTFKLIDASMYVSIFRPGDVVTIHPRIAVSEDLPAGFYPANITGIYKDIKGIYQQIPTVPVRISVARGAVFSMSASNMTLANNGKQTISLTYTNRGDRVAYGAEARITGDQVIVPETDTAALGDVGPGDSVTAEYVISAEKAIPGKQYVLDTEVKYRDSLGALMLSDQYHTGVSIEQPSGLADALSDPVVLIILAAVIACAGFFGWKHLTKKQ